MVSPYIRLRIVAIARHLRDIADGLDAASGPRTLRDIALALTDLQTIVLMALYQWDSEIVQNSKHGFDRTEVK